MGQQISKRIMPHISKAIESHDSVMAKDALQDIARKQAHARATNTKYSDPSAMQGFKRDQWAQHESLPSEKIQNEFYTNQSEQAKEIAIKDMPQDLIQFLNDAGPLKKQVDKELTSPKVYESLLEEEEQRRQQNQQDSRKTRRIMPMVGGDDHDHGDGDGTITTEEEHSLGLDRQDGTTVSRTTNFSTARISQDENEAQLSLDDEEMFRLLSDLQADQLTADQYIESIAGTVTKDDTMKTSVAASEPSSTSTSKSALTQEQEQVMEDNLNLIRNMKEYTAIPILMQDTDKTYVGAWVDKLEDLKLMGVRMVKDNVILSLQDNLILNQGHGLDSQQQQDDTSASSGSSTSTTTTSRQGETKDEEKNLTTAEFLRQAKQGSI